MRPADAHDLPSELRHVKTMLSAQELELLYTVARDGYEGTGEIVDGGAFLGGSTLALACGLRDNRRIADKTGRIHSYDYFVADRFARQFLPDIEEGASTRPYYDSVIAPVADHVTVCEGDIATFPWDPAKRIEVLFIDIAKSWETNDFLLHQFFPQLDAGSLVIQQDYHWPHTPWISATMELLADHFCHLGSMPWATSVYRCTRTIDRDALPASLRDLGAQRLLELARSAQVFDRGSREWTAQQCNIVSLCLWFARVDEAADVFDETSRIAAQWIDYFQFRPNLPVRA